MTENNKLDSMLKAYCNRDTEAFELKTKKSTIKYTAVTAASLVLVILLSILIIPEISPQRDFTLTVSAGSVDSSAITSNDTKLVIGVGGDDITKVSATSQNGFMSISFNSVTHSVVGVYYSEDGSIEEATADIALVSVYEAPTDSNGEPIHQVNDVYQNIDIFDKDKEAGDSEICVVCTPVGDDGISLATTGDFSPKYNDIVEITAEFTDGTTQTKYVSVTYTDSGEMIACETEQ